MDTTGGYHRPVLVDEVVRLLGDVPPGVVVDVTVGGGGHAAALLEHRGDLRLVGLDRDPEAVAAATRRLAPFGDRARVVHGRSDHLADLVGPDEGPVVGVLADLGVSSHQLDEGRRGFSYRNPGPLDMRMDPTTGVSAAELVNRSDRRELARILRRYGDERFADRIARAIVAARPVETTDRLAEIVREAIPAAARRRGGHPATRTFQALRIAVNDELAVLIGTLRSALELLAPGGRLVVISYHSGEDRIVKRIFREATSGAPGHHPPLPVEPPTPPFRLLTRRALRPSDSEIAANPRASAARLRALERRPHPGAPTR